MRRYATRRPALSANVYIVFLVKEGLTASLPFHNSIIKKQSNRDKRRFPLIFNNSHYLVAVTWSLGCRSPNLLLYGRHRSGLQGGEGLVKPDRQDGCYSAAAHGLRRVVVVGLVVDVVQVLAHDPRSHDDG